LIFCFVFGFFCLFVKVKSFWILLFLALVIDLGDVRFTYPFCLTYDGVNKNSIFTCWLWISNKIVELVLYALNLVKLFDNIWMVYKWMWFVELGMECSFFVLLSSRSFFQSVKIITSTVCINFFGCPSC
jgi:hypothetical protein